MWITTRSQHLTQRSSYGRNIGKKGLHNSGVGAMLFTNLSKAFDCQRHILLIAKRAACGFDQPSTYFIYSNLSGRTQRAKVNNTYSSYTNIKYVVP